MAAGFHAPVGPALLLIEPGSTGIHEGWRDQDGFWVADKKGKAVDIYPSDPILYKEK